MAVSSETPGRSITASPRRTTARGTNGPAPPVHYAVGDNRLDIVLENGSKSSMWWATKNEWLGLIDVAGLEVEALYGSYDKEPFTEDSSLYVFVARRERD
jgi:hypothetical protein